MKREKEIHIIKESFLEGDGLYYLITILLPHNLNELQYNINLLPHLINLLGNDVNLLHHTINLLSHIINIFFSSYNVWKHVRYHVLISRHPGMITQFR